MNFDDLHSELLTIVSEVGARPDVPVESETFFSHMVANFDGTREECLSYIKAHLHDWFQCIGPRPEWVQDAEWAFFGGKPMVFVGQTAVGRAAGWFHDDAVFYHFWDPSTGATRSIIQIS